MGTVTRTGTERHVADAHSSHGPWLRSAAAAFTLQYPRIRRRGRRSAPCVWPTVQSRLSGHINAAMANIKAGKIDTVPWLRRATRTFTGRWTQQHTHPKAPARWNCAVRSPHTPSMLRIAASFTPQEYHDIHLGFPWPLPCQQVPPSSPHADHVLGIAMETDWWVHLPSIPKLYTEPIPIPGIGNVM